MNSVPQIKIDYTQIPAIECKLLFRTLAKAVDRFYADPKNRERFAEWQKSRSEEGKSDAQKSESNNAVAADVGASNADSDMQPRVAEA